MAFVRVFLVTLICQYVVIAMVEAGAHGQNFNHHGDNSDYCRDHPYACNYRGTCHSHPNNWYSCHCDSQYEGHRCEVLKVPLTDAPPPPTTTQPTPPPTTPTAPSTTPSTTTAPPSSSTIPTVVTKSIPPSSTVPTTVPSTPAPIHIHSVTCAKLNTITELANQIIAYNQSAVACPSGNHSSPEAFVLKNCQLSLPAFWKRGPNVVKFCSSLPLYSPIAMFGSTKYLSTYQTISGIFMGCLSNPTGIKVAVQECDKVPSILHVTEGGQTDIHAFNVIVY